MSKDRRVPLTHEQLQAIVVGPPWDRLDERTRDTRVVAKRAVCITQSEHHGAHGVATRTGSDGRRSAAGSERGSHRKAAAAGSTACHPHEELKRKQLKIDQLTHEIATLNRWRYAKRSEQLDAVQRSLLDESIDGDIKAISLEIEALQEKVVIPQGKAAPCGASSGLLGGKSGTSPNTLNVAATASSNASARM